MVIYFIGWFLQKGNSTSCVVSKTKTRECLRGRRFAVLVSFVRIYVVIIFYSLNFHYTDHHLLLWIRCLYHSINSYRAFVSYRRSMECEINISYKLYVWLFILLMLCLTCSVCNHKILYFYNSKFNSY